MSEQNTSDRRRNLYLVRHSISENNEAKSHLYGFHFSLVEWKHFKSVLTVDMDSKLSLKGREFCQEQYLKLQEMNFLLQYQIDSIYYSPYHRAKETFEILFQNRENVKIFQEQELLKEQLLSEYFGLHNIEDRVEEFKKWLVNQKDSTNIVLVGHSKFFRCLLKSKIHMKNCEVFHCFMDDSGVIHQGNGVIAPGSGK
jgi:broad specificity phosphatase PhoE